MGVEQSARHGISHQVQNSGLGRNSLQVGMFLARSDESLIDWILAGRDRRNLKHAARRVGVTVISERLRHGVATVGVLILRHTDAGKKHALNYNLSISDGVLVDAYATRKLNRLAAQAAGNGQFIASLRRCGRRETGGDINGRIDADADTHRKWFVHLLSLLEEGSDMASFTKHGAKLIGALDTGTVHGDIVFSVSGSVARKSPNIMYRPASFGMLVGTGRVLRISIFSR